jgi:hypothetical protein
VLAAAVSILNFAVAYNVTDVFVVGSGRRSGQYPSPLETTRSLGVTDYLTPELDPGALVGKFLLRESERSEKRG